VQVDDMTVLSQSSCEELLVSQIKCHFLLRLHVDGHCEAIGFPRAVSLFASVLQERKQQPKDGVSKHVTVFTVEVARKVVLAASDLSPNITSTTAGKICIKFVIWEFYIK
jgi:hypothetical protein